MNKDKYFLMTEQPVSQDCVITINVYPNRRALQYEKQRLGLQP